MPRAIAMGVPLPWATGREAPDYLRSTETPVSPGLWATRQVYRTACDGPCVRDRPRSLANTLRSGAALSRYAGITPAARHAQVQATTCFDALISRSLVPRSAASGHQVRRSLTPIARQGLSHPATELQELRWDAPKLSATWESVINARSHPQSD